MTRTCPEALVLEEILHAGDQHAGWAHVQSCARCRSQLRSLAAFTRAESSVASADLADANQRLSELLDREVLSTDEDPAVGLDRSVSSGRAWWDLRGILSAPVMAAAGVAVIALLLVFVPRGDEPVVPGDLLRGELEGDSMATLTADATWQSNNVLRLAWDPVAGATAYRVLSYDADLQELHRAKVGTELEHYWPDETIDGWLAQTPTLLWRVEAVAEGRVLARSSLSPVPLR